MPELGKILQSPTISAIYNHYEENQSGFREHLGASLIGSDCARQLWYGFRWASPKHFDGRMLRLFETGQMAEDRFVENLESVGVQVWTIDEQTGNQFSFKDLCGHFAGSLDGVGLGIIEAPKTPHLLEFKTHGEKSFAKLLKDGVFKSKPEHVAQMIIYMDYFNLTRAFYLAVNKNTDELYAERFKADPVEAARLKAKARSIITADKPPKGLSTNPSFWKCKFCDFQDVCQLGELMEKNCRTCQHSFADVESGGWGCRFFNSVIEMPLNTCVNYQQIEVLK